MTVAQQNLKLIYAISFVDLLGVGVTYPFFFTHVRSLGASHVTIGLLGSLYSGLQFFSGPLIGSWSDVRGVKSLQITLLLSCVCYFLLGLTSSVVFITFVRILLGCVKHTQTLCKALIGVNLPREQQAEAYGFSSALSTIGFIIGPILGGHISELNHGFYYVCCTTSFLFIINAGLAFALKDIPRKLENEGNNNQITAGTISSTVQQELTKTINNLRLVNWKIYGESFCIRFLFGMSVSIYFSNQSLYLTEKYFLPQKYIGYIISFISLTGTITGFMLGFITKKLYKNDLNCNKRLLHFFTVLTICFVLLYLAPTIYTFVAVLVPYGVSNIILRIVSMELLLTKSNNEAKGSLSGASNSVMSLARFVSPITSGVIIDMYGTNAVMLSAFIPALLGTIMCVKMNYTNRNKKKQ